MINEVSTAQEARASIQKMAGLGIKAVKIWVDDRRGTYPKMTPEVYTAIIDEAHKHGMIVHAHATTLADQKAVVRAGPTCWSTWCRTKGWTTNNWLY